MSTFIHRSRLAACLGALALLCSPAFAKGPSKGNAAADLPRMKGKSVPKVEKTLKKKGFSKAKASKKQVAGKQVEVNQTWKHKDGSEVRVHKYGNEKQAPFKSANNAHVHKEDPQGHQLDDRGHRSADPKKTHIGIKNPKNLPAVRGRPHGAGTQ